MTAVAIATNPFLEARLRYQDSCELFVRECFGFPNAEEQAEGKDIYPWQLEAMMAYDRQEPRIAIRSGHGVGKTTLLAWIAWHRILWRFPQKTAMTAPSEKQVFDAFWAEFEAWGHRLPKTLRDLVEIKADAAELVSRRAESFISIKTARAEQPEALQGLHSTWELVIVDEASGVPESVWEAAQSSLTGPHPMAILTGNPISREGFFHAAHTRLRETWRTLHVPRSAIVDVDTDPYAQQVEAESGGRHTNRYRVRVEGEFPLSEDDVFIPFELVEAAFDRDVEIPKTDVMIWGLDCARFGQNRSALAKRQTRQLLERVHWWAKLDTVELAARVKAEWETTPDFLKPQVICVDAIGIGAGVADSLRAVGLPVRAINVSETPSLANVERYENLGTELWARAKDWLARRDCRIPEYYRHPKDGDDFVGELTTRTYQFAKKSGKLMLAPKTGVYSPDLADAFVLTFAADAVALARARDRTGGPYTPRLLKGLI